MALDVSAEVHREACEKGLFVHTSSCHPFVLIIAPDTLPQMGWKLSVTHPLLGICPPDSPFFKPDSS